VTVIADVVDDAAGADDAAGTDDAVVVVVVEVVDD
jgi:hypothetical protein